MDTAIGEAQKAPDFGLWAENESALVVLFAMSTQLRLAGMSGTVCGLDYNALPLVMRQIKVEFDADGELFARIQAAESELVAWFSDGACR